MWRPTLEEILLRGNAFAVVFLIDKKSSIFFKKTGKNDFNSVEMSIFNNKKRR
jgi:hypothetical protein